MADSHLLGADFKLYGFTASDEIGNAEAFNNFQSATFIKNISIAYPFKDGNGSVPAGGSSYLFSANGELNLNLVSILDAYASRWFAAPVIFWIDPGFSGPLLPTTKITDQFPAATILNDYNFNFFYITKEGFNYVWIIRMLASHYDAVVCNKTTGEVVGGRSGFEIPFIILGAPGYSNYTWLEFPIVENLSTGQSYIYSSIGYIATQNRNGLWFGNRSSRPLNSSLLTILEENYVPIMPSSDPYDGAGNSDVGGGGGTFDYSGNPPGGFDDFVLPSISAVDTGFVTLYNPTVVQLKQLSNYLWSSAFDLNAFKKIFNDPMDLFLGLSIVPVAVPDGGQKEVGIGAVGTEIFMTVAASQWVPVQCGSVNIPLFSGSYLDYDPYTTIEIYLPFIGVRTLKADEVMGRNLKVSYMVDILSGACVAWLDVDGHVTYTYMGQCATSIPVVSGDWTNLINGILSVVGSAVGGAVKGGVGGAIAGGVAAAASVAVSDGKISVERSGTISSAGGLIAHKKPFLIISSPNLHKPAMQNTFEGYPLYVTRQLSDVSGYTEVEVIHLYNIPATEDEISEIKTLLLSGVIL